MQVQDVKQTIASVPFVLPSLFMGRSWKWIIVHLCDYVSITNGQQQNKCTRPIIFRRVYPIACQAVWYSCFAETFHIQNPLCYYSIG
jgi:hypothetical protein